MTKLLLPPDGLLRAITVKEPFANLIAKGFKTVENRGMPLLKAAELPMTVAIHAGSDDNTIADDIEANCDHPVIFDSFNHPKADPFKAGRTYYYRTCLIGLVDIVDIVCIADCMDDEDEIARRVNAFPLSDNQTSIPDATRFDWANGPQCHILANPRRFKTGYITPGKLGAWRVSPDIQKVIETNLMKNLLIDPQALPTAPLGGMPRFLGRPMIA